MTAIRPKHNLKVGIGPLAFKAAGIEEAAAESSLPFFIEWGSGTIYPGYALVKHPGGTPAITGIQLHGDADRLAVWLNGYALPVTVSPGDPMFAGLVLSRVDGEIVLGASLV